ncbi:MAG: rhomboid family intramembrane serine protease [Holophagae bacterium]
MFLPISDAPNPKGVPVVTWTIIALNVLAYLFINVPFGAQPADVNDPAYGEYLRFLSQIVQNERELDLARQQISAYDLFVFKYGYRPAQLSILDLFFAMFLHGGFMHLFGNMLFLWIYGDNVERRLGAFWFVVWYLLTGVAATFFHAMFFPSSEVPLIGASGAISGVLGFYFVWFPKNMVRVLIFLPPFFIQTFQIAARIVLAIYLFIDNVLPFLLAGGGGVAHGAHIGGFVAGALAALVMNRRAVESHPKDIARPREAPSGAQSVRAALQNGHLDEAAAEYLALPAGPARGALSPTEAVFLAGRLRAAGHSDAALVLLQRVIRSAPRAPGVAEAYALGGFILLDHRRDPTAAFQYLMAALKAGPDPGTRSEIERRLEAIEAQQRVHPGRFQRRRSVGGSQLK